MHHISSYHSLFDSRAKDDSFTNIGKNNGIR